MKLYDTKSVCPECLRVVEASVIEENGSIYMVKSCPEHGEFKHIYWRDAELFKKVMEYSWEGRGVENPAIKDTNCPYACGLCPIHKSHTSLGIIDVTNRCNLKCPVCFDAAFATGYVYEPTKEQIRMMLRRLRQNKPVPAPAVQLTGGEPTIRADLFEIVKMAREEGFPHVEVNTNGVRIAMEPGYAEKLREAGCTTIYLSFEGFEKSAYIHKGSDLTDIKLKAVERCREAGIGVVLVPTLIKGVNDNQLGKMVEFAAKNVDVIRCLNIQPVSFVGRFELEDIDKHRITTDEVLKLIEEQTNGKVKVEDFRPVTYPAPLSRLLGLLEGREMVEFTMNPHCGMATYIYVKEDGDYIPITRFVDVDLLWKTCVESVKKIEKGGWMSKQAVKLKLLSILPKLIKSDEAPEGLNLTDILKDIIVKRDYKSLAKFHFNRMVMIGLMHFQDSLNLDFERLMRCGIHYSTPDGRLIPFCAMNLTDIHGRSLYRKQIEKKFAIPLEQWEREHGVKQSSVA